MKEWTNIDKKSVHGRRCCIEVLICNLNQTLDDFDAPLRMRLACMAAGRLQLNHSHPAASQGSSETIVLKSFSIHAQERRVVSPSEIHLNDVYNMGAKIYIYASLILS